MSDNELIDLYVAHLRELDHTDKTIKVYQRTLIAADRDLPFGLERAHEREIRAWIWREKQTKRDDQLKQLAASSRANYFATVAGFFRWAVEVEEILDYDPTRRIKAPRVPRREPRVARHEQVRQVMTRAENPFLLWAQLAVYAGVRCIEIFRMQREHITQQQLIIHRGKGDKPRVLPTHKVIWSAVQALPPGRLVTGYDDQDDMSRDFISYCRRKLDLSGVSLHRLRGRWATNGYHQSKDILAVGKGMGHSNPGITAGYIDVADTELQAIVDGLPIYA